MHADLAEEHSPEYSPGGRDLLGKKFGVLNRGFVRLVDYMGSDAAIVQAARVSYGKGTKHVREDRGLIRYLMRHRHSSPFEMCELKFHVKLPIFIARQWVRHRTASLNEYSARYSEMREEFYIPNEHSPNEHSPNEPSLSEPSPNELSPSEQGSRVLFIEASLGGQSQSNRQGRSSAAPMLARGDKRKETSAKMFRRAQSSFAYYKDLLSAGLSRELARITLPLSTYTEFYWKSNLHNLFHFLALRMDAHAQDEIRLYARVIFDEIVRPLFPIASEAFIDYRLESKLLSRAEIKLLQELLAGSSIERPATGFSEREWSAFVRAFELKEK